MTKKVLFLNPVPLISRGILPAFQRCGWQTVLCEFDEYFLGRIPEEQERMLNNCLEKYEPDLVFLDFGAGANIPVIHQCCQKHNTPFLIWGIEDVPDDPQWMEQSINNCDIYLTTTQEFIKPIKEEYGRDAYLFTFGVPTFPKEPKVSPEYQYDIVFVGNNYSSRYSDFSNFIGPLIDQQYNINVWGNDWWLNSELPVNLCNNQDIYHGYFNFDDLNSLYYNSKVAIGLNCSKLSTTQTSMRPYEVMSVGGAIYIAPWSPAQENLFGEYCFLPKTPQKMLDDIDYILGMSDDDRLKMAKKAQKMIYKKYSYDDKLKKLLEALEL